MKSYECENCKRTFFENEFNSKRFCSVSCRKSYAGKKAGIARRKNKYPRVKSRKPYGTWSCNKCTFIANTRHELEEHKRKKHNAHKGWNKGLTKESNSSIKKRCDVYMENIKNGITIPGFKGKHHSNSTKIKMSNSAKKSLINGLHNTWAMSRNSNGYKTSGPELEFIQFLNSIGNTQYIREYPFYGYSLDFAWPSEKKCIEIDGEQHYEDRFDHSSDRRKERMLKKHNWKLLRLRWNNEKKSKNLIEKVKNFLNMI